MSLDEFLNEFLENLISEEVLNKVKQDIKEDMKSYNTDYNTAKVESQVFDKDNNYTPRVEISSEGYSDGEIIFIDYYLD